MKKLKQMLTSKTIDFNVFMASVVTILIACGVTVKPEVVTAVSAIGNIVLRMITYEPISAKGKKKI